jgi:hypothetical protein
VTSQTEKIELIRRGNEILDRINAALTLPWFEEELMQQPPEELRKAA